jgi:hypothetical protein
MDSAAARKFKQRLADGLLGGKFGFMEGDDNIGFLLDPA